MQEGLRTTRCQCWGTSKWEIRGNWQLLCPGCHLLVTNATGGGAGGGHPVTHGFKIAVGKYAPALSLTYHHIVVNTASLLPQQRKRCKTPEEYAQQGSTGGACFSRFLATICSKSRCHSANANYFFAFAAPARMLVDDKSSRKAASFKPLNIPGKVTGHKKVI